MAFAGSNIESITIPSSVVKIDVAAFHLINTLKSVKFEYGSKISILPYSLFDATPNIEELILPSSIREIHEGVFNGWKNVYKIYLCSNHDLSRVDLTGVTGTLQVYASYSYKRLYKTFGGIDVITPNHFCDIIYSCDNEKYKHFSKNNFLFIMRF